MQQFIEKYGHMIKGTLCGFDRLVLRGSPRRLNHTYFDATRKIMVARGMEEFLWQNQILFKNYGDYVKKISERLRNASTKAYRDANLPLIYLQDTGADKEQQARQVAAERGITSGAVCVISSVEPSPTFDYIKSKIARRIRPCHVLYHYRIDEQFGWMYGRIQTWFPFNIQIGLNGREWLAQQMSGKGMKFTQAGNCFTK